MSFAQDNLPPEEIFEGMASENCVCAVAPVSEMLTAMESDIELLIGGVERMPIKAATLVPTPAMGAEPEATSST
jgi:hypothetical protein